TRPAIRLDRIPAATRAEPERPLRRAARTDPFGSAGLPARGSSGSVLLNVGDALNQATCKRTSATRRPLTVLAALAACLAALAWPVSLEPQYFGRNKVPWERFEFEVLESEPFLIRYSPPDAPHAEYVAALAERWHARLAKFFDHELEERKPLVIYANHADFQQTVITPGLIGEGTGGFTESALDRVVLPLTGINADNDHVIGHELVHVFQFDLMERLAQGGQRTAQLPLWMIEGLAEYLSQGRVDPATALWMRDAVLHGLLPDP